MLASIHPLGERARGQRFGLTVTAYTIGSMLGGVTYCGGSAALGRALLGPDPGSAALVVLASAALVAAALDRAGVPVPSWHRQVNEDWLADFRGWVYGFGFGYQLGLGVVTIVTTAAVYLTGLAAFLTAAPGAGIAIGATFGLARAMPVLAAARSTTPEAVAGRVRTLDAWAGRFRAVTVATELLAAVAFLVVVVR